MGEAQCAAMAKCEIVNAVGTRDTDTIVLGCPETLFDFSVKSEQEILKIDYNKALKSLDMTPTKVIFSSH